MAPHNRVSAQHSDTVHRHVHARNAAFDASSDAVNDELFLEPMMGTPLAIYIEKDVADRDQLVEIITKHGGTVAPGYSGVPYILVDPHKESGQSLFRQYKGKKAKIVLDARWVHECVRTGELQTFHTSWAGCKVTGNEQLGAQPVPIPSTLAPSRPSATRRGRPQGRAQPAQPVSGTNYAIPPQPLPATSAATPVIHPSAPLPAQNFTYNIYPGQAAQHTPSRPALQPPTSAPPQSWQAPNGIAPHQAHVPHTHTHQQILPSRPQNPYGRDEHWNDPAFPHITPGTETGPIPPINDTPAPGYYDHRFRDDQGNWPEPAHEYYDQQTYTQPYQPPAEPYMPMPGPSSTAVEPQVPASTGPERPRGRKRTRTQAPPAPPASTLVLNRRHPPARSPTPPTRVIKSTYGGNLFTSDDVLYLKKYIDYCQEQGLVLSLREICERIALRASHHTFYSWRRYCNKHQIRLGGYAMGPDSRSPSPMRHEDMNNNQAEDIEMSHNIRLRGPGPFTIAAAQDLLLDQGRNRSPTPPRALFRSTTGKGVAFTGEDVSFLCKFLAYRKAQGKLDMVTFWKEVANKAPHHSRASWMKYYRRHKHELHRVEGDEPLPAPPSKKMRYGRNDDILLARYFVNRPEGTSDKIFQEFAKIYPHHPWKGWQEHHRIHKAKIDHLMQRLSNGETIDLVEEDE